MAGVVRRRLPCAASTSSCSSLRSTDDGYVISRFRALVVSNSLACMNAEQAVRDGVLGADVEIVTHLLDETVRRIPVRAITLEPQRRFDRLRAVG